VKYPGVPVTVSHRHGLDAAIVVAAASRTAALVAVAAQPDRWAGSPAQAIADRAHCPVLVVPAP
jgi:nucleotide-binding universal stress UspA family protein